MSTSRHIIQLSLIALLVGEFWNNTFSLVANISLNYSVLSSTSSPACWQRNRFSTWFKFWMIKWNKKQLCCSFVSRLVIVNVKRRISFYGNEKILKLVYKITCMHSRFNRLNGDCNTEKKSYKENEVCPNVSAVTRTRRWFSINTIIILIWWG